VRSETAAAVVVLIAALVNSTAADETLLIRLPSEVTSPRSMGLGGAMVGLGGDASSFASNPASLIAVPRSLDAVVAGGNHGSYMVAVGLHPFRNWAFGVLLPTADHRLELVRPRPEGGEVLRPKDGRWGALSVARTLFDRRFSIGASLEVEHLRLLDESGRGSARQTWGPIIGTVGLFVQPDARDGTRLGVAYRRGLDRNFDATADTFGNADTTYRVRRPEVISFGASWRYGWLKNTHLVFTVQPELIRYQIVAANAGTELDFRAGLEASFPLGSCVSGCGGMWQLRGGLVSRSGIPSLVPTFNQGYDPGRRGTVFTGGGSIADPRVFSGKLKLDVGYSGGCDSQSRRCHTWTVGLSGRFPSAFRGDLQYNRPPR